MPCLTISLARAALAGLVAAVLAPIAPASAEKRIAITVGIDAYDNLAADQQLRKAVNDSRSVGTALSSIGFEVISGENMPRVEFNRVWQRFLNRIEPGDTVTVFFAGHGIEIGGSNFLLARDVPRATAGEDEFLKSETIAVARLLEDVRSRQPKLSVLILDACRSNPFQQAGGRSVGGSRGLARVEAPEGTFVMFSAGTGEAALDRLGDDDREANSVYTRKLVPLLTQPGLSLPDLAQEVRRQVRELALTVRHRQTPAYYDEVVGRFCLANCSGEPKSLPQIAAAAPAATLTLPPREPEKLAAPNEALPTDLPVRPDVLRVIETDPFFANAPPVRVGAHTVISNMTSSTGGVGTSTTSSNDETTTRWLRSGLIRQDLVQNYTVNNSGSVGRYSVRSSSFSVANGLFLLSYKYTNTSVQRTVTTSRLLRIDNMRGRVFPVTLGNKFSYDMVSEWKSSGSYSSSGTSTSKTSCAVTRRLDAKTFHANLTGDAYLLLCDSESTEKDGKTSKSRSRDIFIDMLGIWLRADPVSPKEPLITSNDITVTGQYTTVSNGFYTLTAFTLAR